MCGIFKDVGQAVHFALMIEEYPVIRGAPLPMQLSRDARREGVDFDGLTPTEVRAQCASIRRKMLEQLPALDDAVLRAKFGFNTAEIRTVAITFAESMTGNLTDRKMAERVIMRHYLMHGPNKADWTIREVASASHVSKDKVMRMAERFKFKIERAEHEAMERLRVGFEQAGIIN